jgi:uncharacterized lipoprotein YajG
MKNTTGVLAAIILLSSCSNYYKVITVSSPDISRSTAALNMKNRFFILHSDSAVFAMNTPSVSDDNTINCALSSLPDNHKLHLPGLENKKLKYKGGRNEYDETGVLNEVHLYVSSDGSFTNGSVKIPLNTLNKIEIIEKDKQKTKKSHTIGFAISTVSVIVAAGIIIASSLKFGP